MTHRTLLAALLLTATAGLVAFAEGDDRFLGSGEAEARAAALVDQGPLARLRRQAQLESDAAQVRQSASWLLEPSETADRDALLELAVRDVDPAVRGRAIARLMAGGPVQGKDKRWRFPGLDALDARLQREPERLPAVMPAISELTARYVTAELHRLVEIHDTIYFEQMFERMEACKRHVARPILGLFSSYLLNRHSISADRAQLVNFAGKAIGDLRLRELTDGLDAFCPILEEELRYERDWDKWALRTAEVSLYKLGRTARAHKLTRELQRNARLYGNWGRKGIRWVMAQDALAHHYLRLGEYQKAIDAYKQMIVAGMQLKLAHYNTACAYSKMGRVPQGLMHLKLAIDNGFISDEDIEHDRDLDNLRSHPRYQKMLDELRARNARQRELDR